MRPERGRTFGPDEGVVPGRDPVVVLSHDFWATVLDADDSVVDDVVWLNGVAFTVIGVTEESFTGMGAIRRPAFYVPAVMAESLGDDEDVLESRTVGRFGVYGRLRPGVSQQAAHAEVEAQWAGLQREHPDANVGSTLAVRTVRQERIEGDPSVVILIPVMMGLAFIVLLIACANVASLLLRWATARSVEVATRMALGGGASRLLRQFLTESLLLALLGTGVGIALSFFTIRLVGNIAEPGDGLPLVIEPRMNHRALLFSLALTGVTAVLAGLAPARYGLKTRLVSLLNHARQGEAGRSRTLGRSALVVVQVALSMVLLVTTGLMMDSIGKSAVLDPGYRTDRRLMMTLDTSHVQYGPARTRAFCRQLVDEVRALPGVTSVALANWLSLDRRASVERVIPEGYQLPPYAGNRHPPGDGCRHGTGGVAGHASGRDPLLCRHCGRWIPQRDERGPGRQPDGGRREAQSDDVHRRPVRPDRPDARGMLPAGTSGSAHEPRGRAQARIGALRSELTRSFAASTRTSGPGNHSSVARDAPPYVRRNGRPPSHRDRGLDQPSRLSLENVLRDNGRGSQFSVWRGRWTG